ncbi:MAG: NADH-quinone oxidoreductase subunit J [Acidimicrobiia bacterium]
MITVILFFVTAAIVLVGALGVILARNPVHSALFLVQALVGMAVFFVMQDAQLVAAVQIIVYASAVVVLFLFVITLLGVDKRETMREPLEFQRPLAIGLGLLLIVEIIAVSGVAWTHGPACAAGTACSLSSPQYGNIEVVAQSIFTSYVWPFELVAALLVIAVVGAVVLARRTPVDDELALEAEHMVVVDPNPPTEVNS